MSAGDLSTLGQDADRVAPIESLSVPSGGGGIGRDMCVLIFEWAGSLRWPRVDVGALRLRPSELTKRNLPAPAVKISNSPA